MLLTYLLPILLLSNLAVLLYFILTSNKSKTVLYKTDVFDTNNVQFKNSEKYASEFIKSDNENAVNDLNSALLTCEYIWKS